jgi:hypothetical protein
LQEILPTTFFAIAYDWCAVANGGGVAVVPLPLCGRLADTPGTRAVQAMTFL